MLAVWHLNLIWGFTSEVPYYRSGEMRVTEIDFWGLTATFMISTATLVLLPVDKWCTKVSDERCAEYEIEKSADAVECANVVVRIFKDDEWTMDLPHELKERMDVFGYANGDSEDDAAIVERAKEIVAIIREVLGYTPMLDDLKKRLEQFSVKRPCMV